MGDKYTELREKAEAAAFRCCECPDTGGVYMGSVEYICCGNPESTEADISWPAEELLALVDERNGMAQLLREIRSYAGRGVSFAINARIDALLAGTKQ